MSTWILLNAIGHDAAIALQRACGGSYVRIPRTGTLPDDDPVVVAIGREAADRLVSKVSDVPECANGKLYIGNGLVRQERNAAILADSSAGQSIAHIAREYRMTQENVRKVLALYSDEIGAPVGAQSLRR